MEIRLFGLLPFFFQLLAYYLYIVQPDLLLTKKMGGNTEYYLFKHFVLIILSLFAMWFSHKLDYKYYSKISQIGLYISVPLLLFTYKFGQNINEATRWIEIPIINQAFQYCYLNQAETGSVFMNIINSNQGDYSRYLFFHFNK